MSDHIPLIPRKRLKVLYGNLAAVDRELVLHITQQYITTTLDSWRRLPMKDVEAAITMLYMLGEALPTPAAGNFFSDDLVRGEGGPGQVVSLRSGQGLMRLWAEASGCNGLYGIA